MQHLLEGAEGVRLPNGAAFTLGTFVKDRLASNRESQIHTPLRFKWWNLRQTDACRRGHATWHLCRVRQCLCNSKIVVKGGRNNVRRYQDRLRERAPLSSQM